MPRPNLKWWTVSSTLRALVMQSDPLSSLDTFTALMSSWSIVSFTHFVDTSLKLPHVFQRFAVTLGHNAEAGRGVTSNFDGNAPEESFQVVEHADHSSKRISQGNYLSLSSAEADILL